VQRGRQNQLNPRILAIALSAVTLAACSQPAGTPKESILKEIAPVKAGDVFPELIGVLRPPLKATPGADISAVYAATDKQLAPVIADFEARLARAPQKIGKAPGPIVKKSAAYSAALASFPDLRAGGSAGGETSLTLLTADESGRVVIEQKTYDAGERFTGDGIVEDVKGVMETYVENGEVVTHIDMSGTGTKESGEGATAQTVVTVESLLVGERVAADGKKTGQKTYVELCPDAAGLSHGKLHFQMSAGGNISGPSGKSGGQATFIVTADLMGHVDDSATLTSYDLLNLSFQRSASGTGSSDSAGYFADGVSLTGVAPVRGESAAWTSGGKAAAGPSARTSIHNMKRSDVEREIGLMTIFAKMHADQLYRIAEKGWQHGYCVKVAATKGPDPKRLKPGGTAQFTIEVFHLPDKAKLDVPVVANARNGKVDPGAKPVMPPVKYSFTADGGKPKGYGVALKSTSRRGIGELSINFSPQGYRLKIVAHVSGGGPPPRTWTITGTVVPDPSDSFLVGPGVVEDHLFVNPELGCPGNWKDLGPRTDTVELKAIDKGDGNYEVQATPTGASVILLGNVPETVATFPAGDGERVVAQGTDTSTDQCTAGDALITVTTVTNWTIEADPVPIT
jgi:hypothetical protein